MGSPTTSTLSGFGYTLVVENFSRVSAYASTGLDTAQLRGSPQNDVYVGRPEYAMVKNSLYTLLAFKFDSVSVDGFGGNDTATSLIHSGMTKSSRAFAQALSRHGRRR